MLHPPSSQRPVGQLVKPQGGRTVCISFAHVFQEMIKSIVTAMEAQRKHYQPLVCEKSKPVPLKLFTPRLVKV